MLDTKINNGFTLVELMIVLAILGTLMAIAIPAYNTHIERARRNDAKAALTTAAQAMERFFTENGNYKNAELGTAATAIAKTTTPDGFYTIGFDSTPTVAAACGAVVTTNVNESAYRLCATPMGKQANDSCEKFSLSQTGAKLPTTSGCW